MGVTRLVEERFWEKVNKTEGCWLWTATKYGFGYGGINIAGTMVGAHRYSYELHKGPIPAGLCVLHHCDNPACVNPDHLFLGTNLDNATDRGNKGRTAFGENSGKVKLTNSEVEEVFKHSRQGLTHRAIAIKYGVSHTQIGQILSGKQRKK